MPTIVRFEEIQAWQEARALTRLIYRLTSSGAWAKDYGLRDQIRKAAVSIMSNIAEGFDRQGTAEFRRFLAIAKGSAAEVKCQLYIAADLSYLSEDESRSARKLIDTVSRLIGAFMTYLNDLPRKSKPANSPTRKPVNLERPN